MGTDNVSDWDWEDKKELEMRKKETKAERRARRKREMKEILVYEATHKEQIVTQGVFVMERRCVQKNPVEQKEIELLQLVTKARQGRYSDEEIGKLFRKIFKDF